MSSTKKKALKTFDEKRGQEGKEGGKGVFESELRLFEGLRH